MARTKKWTVAAKFTSRNLFKFTQSSKKGTTKMTDRTFFKWVNAYAEAVKELSWIGSIEMASERSETKSYWLARKRKAKAMIVQARYGER